MNFDTYWYHTMSSPNTLTHHECLGRTPALRTVGGDERMAFRAASAAVVARGLGRTDGFVRAASVALWFARSASSLQPAPPTLLGMGEEALTRLARDMGQPAYRGKQIHDAIYGMRKASVDDIKQLPESFREQLVSAGLEVGRRAPVEVVSSPDGTRASGRPHGCWATTSSTTSTDAP